MTDNVPADPNRQIRYWRAGEGIPGVVWTGVVLYLLCAVGLIVSALFMWAAEPPTSEDVDRQKTIDAVASALRWIGGVEMIGAGVLCLCVPGLLRGRARHRTLAMAVTGVVVLVALGSWLIGVGGPAQPVLALLLALAALAVYRPAVKTFYGQKTGDDR
ncbi:hypothetical protein [Corynebacterium terpenotabidum]|uniref:Uncharacterized protein n=1 Tax=Corynebacterium terpenotabidum Y-11 TaxID=1200352 RepID=S4XGF2_9CORY|nr:hypothetical protein [Corynebacterium terpenotabidum]AGP31659.1 hypothetical protein A606_10100 [Corynebacterium terpenotabidum Y-11]